MTDLEQQQLIQAAYQLVPGLEEAVTKEATRVFVEKYKPVLFLSGLGILGALVVANTAGYNAGRKARR